MIIFKKRPCFEFAIWRIIKCLFFTGVLLSPQSVVALSDPWNVLDKYFADQNNGAEFRRIDQLPLKQRQEHMESAIEKNDRFLLYLYLNVLVKDTNFVEYFKDTNAITPFKKALNLIEQSIIIDSPGIQLLPQIMLQGVGGSVDLNTHSEQIERIRSLLAAAIVQSGLSYPVTDRSVFGAYYRLILQLTNRSMFLEEALNSRRHLLGVNYDPSDLTVIAIGANSLAQNLGILKDDKIISVNGSKVKSSQTLNAAIALSPENSVFQVDVLRNDKIITLQTKIGYKQTDPSVYWQALFFNGDMDGLKSIATQEQKTQCHLAKNSADFFKYCETQSPYYVYKQLLPQGLNKEENPEAEYWRVLLERQPDTLIEKSQILNKRLSFYITEHRKNKDLDISSTQHIDAQASARLMASAPLLARTNWLGNAALVLSLGGQNWNEAIPMFERLWLSVKNRNESFYDTNGSEFKDTILLIDYFAKLRAGLDGYTNPKQAAQINRYLASLPIESLDAQDREILARHNYRYALNGYRENNGAFSEEFNNHLERAILLGSDKAKSFRASQLMGARGSTFSLDPRRSWTLLNQLEAVNNDEYLSFLKTSLIFAYSKDIDASADDINWAANRTFLGFESFSDENQERYTYSALIALQDSFDSKNITLLCEETKEILREKNSDGLKTMAALLSLENCPTQETYALRAVKKMSRKGYPVATAFLAEQYADGGYDLKQDLTKASELLQKAIVQKRNYKSKTELSEEIKNSIDYSEELKVVEQELALISEARKRKDIMEAEERESRKRKQLAQRAKDRSDRKAAGKNGSFLSDLLVAAVTTYVAVKVVKELSDESNYQRGSRAPSRRAVQVLPTQPVTQDKTDFFQNSRPAYGSEANKASRKSDVVFINPQRSQSSSIQCSCHCVDGSMVSLCNSTLAVRKACYGNCPVAIPKRQFASLKPPPPGTSKCEIRQVFNYEIGKYEDKDICF